MAIFGYIHRFYYPRRRYLDLGLKIPVAIARKMAWISNWWGIKA
jgi:hypothetical protein